MQLCCDFVGIFVETRRRAKKKSEAKLTKKYKWIVFFPIKEPKVLLVKTGAVARNQDEPAFEQSKSCQKSNSPSLQPPPAGRRSRSRLARNYST